MMLVTLRISMPPPTFFIIHNKVYTVGLQLFFFFSDAKSIGQQTIDILTSLRFIRRLWHSGRTPVCVFT